MQKKENFPFFEKVQDRYIGAWVQTLVSQVPHPDLNSFKQEGNFLSDLRRMDMLIDTDNYIIIGTYVCESYES